MADTVIVTTGASAGIGAAAAELLARDMVSRDYATVGEDPAADA